MIDRIFQRFSEKSGLPPGTIVHLGDKQVAPPQFRIVQYSEQAFEESKGAGVEDLPDLPISDATSWVHLQGIHEPEVIEQLGSKYTIHPLVLEDIANTGHRPKFDDTEVSIFLVLKTLTYDEENEEVIPKHLCFLLTTGTVFTFQESGPDSFSGVTDRLRSGKGKIRKKGGDYLTYALLDSTVDNYYVILEKIGERIEQLEDDIVINPTADVMTKIHTLRREMTVIRKSIWPLREVIGRLEKEESFLIHDDTRKYFRDVYDHIIQSVEIVETFRDMLAGLHDIYLSSISNRMNEIMKILTVIATIFIPLTFIAGLYGMNFTYMPELQWRWGYFVVLAVMLLIGIGMGMYFKRNKII
jgi:magnesium transporter